MNNHFTLRQWLKSQTPMAPPNDDFGAIYAQLNDAIKPNHIRPWFMAAAIMAIMFSFLVFTNGPSNRAIESHNLTGLQQQISQLENNLILHKDDYTGRPGSGDLENQVQLEQWLNHLNKRLAGNNNAQQTYQLLQAKLSILKSLTPQTQSIQLI